MGVALPPELTGLAERLGAPWPAADEDALRAGARRWRDTAVELETLARDVEDQLSYQLAGFAEDAAPVSPAETQRICGERGVLPVSADECLAAARRLDHAADQIGAAKTRIVLLLVSVANADEQRGETEATAELQQLRTTLRQAIDPASGITVDADVEDQRPPPPEEPAESTEDEKGIGNLLAGGAQSAHPGDRIGAALGTGGVRPNDRWHADNENTGPVSPELLRRAAAAREDAANTGPVPVPQPDAPASGQFAQAQQSSPPSQPLPAGSPSGQHPGTASRGLPVPPNQQVQQSQGQPGPQGQPNPQSQLSPQSQPIPQGQPSPQGQPIPQGQQPNSPGQQQWAASYGQNRPVPQQPPMHTPPPQHPAPQAPPSQPVPTWHGQNTYGQASPGQPPPGQGTHGRLPMPPGPGYPAAPANQPAPNQSVPNHAARNHAAQHPTSVPPHHAMPHPAAPNQPPQQAHARPNGGYPPQAAPAHPPTGNQPTGNPPAGNPSAGNPPAGNLPSGNPSPGNPPSGNPAGARSSRKNERNAETTAFVLHQFPMGYMPVAAPHASPQLPEPEDPAAGGRRPADHPRFGLISDADAVARAKSRTPAEHPESDDRRMPEALLTDYDPLGGLDETEWSQRFRADRRTVDKIDYRWPPVAEHPDGGSSPAEAVELAPGDLIDLLGSPRQRIVTAAGTRFAERSLPPEHRERDYRVYRVVRTLPAWRVTVAPWFGQPGGGVRYRLPHGVAELVALGQLLELTPERLAMEANTVRITADQVAEADRKTTEAAPGEDAAESETERIENRADGEAPATEDEREVHREQ